MYLIFGSTIEYVRDAERLLIVPLIGSFGIIKIFLGIYDNYIEVDLDTILISTLQIVHFIVIMRLAISMIFITALAKWFSRKYLLIIMGVWFSNEFFAFIITRLLSAHKDLVVFISGFALCFCAYLILKVLFKFDPIDAGLLVNE
jgi:hypothetical protein